MVHYIGINQHPGNETFCEGSSAILSCVIFDNSTNNAADTTNWFTNENPPASINHSMINNIRDGDVVTSVLTIESVSLNDNGTGYLCSPSLRIESYVGVISVAGNYDHLVATYIIIHISVLYITRYIKKFEFKKGSRDCNKK